MTSLLFLIADIFPGWAIIDLWPAGGTKTVSDRLLLAKSFNNCLKLLAPGIFRYSH